MLSFQEDIIQLLTKQDGLLLLARGLGLRSIVTDLLRRLSRPSNLILLLGASSDDDRAFTDVLGHSLFTSLTHEQPNNYRQTTYTSTPIVSITSRILIVDLLAQKIPLSRVSGIILLRAEHVTPTSTEAFIIRVFRESNRTAFIKAFSDNPEHFTFGIAPLQTCLTNLNLRDVFFWPRFHTSVQESLAKRKADVIELHQPLSPSMDELQTAIISCLDATVTEIRRYNIHDLDADDINVENALFRSFDAVLNAKFDPMLHKIGPKSRQLLADMSELRRLLNYLLSLDCVSFQQYLETIIASNSTKTHKSPWLFLDAADTLFRVARRRAYETLQISSSNDNSSKENNISAAAQDEDAEAALLEIEQDYTKQIGEKRTSYPWLPPSIKPVLEEQPKWYLLGEVMEEIENDILNAPVDPFSTSKDTILIMCGSQDMCRVIKSYLSSEVVYEKDGKTVKETRGASMLRNRLKRYFQWKTALGRMNQNLTKANNNTTTSVSSMAQRTTSEIDSPAVRRKNEYKRGQQPANKRRRVRGGSSSATNTRSNSSGTNTGVSFSSIDTEAKELAKLNENSNSTIIAEDDENEMADEDIIDVIVEASSNNNQEFNVELLGDFFGICEPQDLVVIRTYMGEEDDCVLEELQPKFVIMMEPDPAFIRRVEVFRSSRPGQNIRVYFMIYGDSAEEQIYLSSIRREKESFERLIKEHSVMAIPLEARRSTNDQDEGDLLRAVSTRIGGGGRLARADPPRIIVDMREFRSALPSLLHNARFVVVPLTLIVGDYILSPDMVVERKSVPDLVQSFNSGRLYQQCELMTVHYKQPILLIEFDEKKGFTLDAYVETKASTPANDTDLMSKLVLLTLSFPRLRIIWSYSPAGTADIFTDLKLNQDEPDPAKAAVVGAEGENPGGASSVIIEGAFNLVPQEILRSLPGVTTKNYRYIMQRVKNLQELTLLKIEEIQEMIGNEAGRTLHTFLHRDVRTE